MEKGLTIKAIIQDQKDIKALASAESSFSLKESITVDTDPQAEKVKKAD